MNSSKLMYIFGLTAILGLVAVAPGAPRAVTIDDFTVAYPAHPDLPVSGAEMIFVGSMCDGGACPPGLLVYHMVSDASHQMGLSGVLGGERSATIHYVTGTANSYILTDLGWMTMNHNAGAKAWMDLTYGETVNLNANLSTSATKFIVSVASGDMYAGPRPVPCTITVTSKRGTPQQATASVTVSLINETDYDFLFASFVGIDFSDVDMISYRFDASNVSSVDFGIGPLRTDGPTVPTDESTWGEVKSLYE